MIATHPIKKRQTMAYIAPVRRLAYLNEGLLDCRLKGIQTALNRRDPFTARDLITECVRLFRSGDWDMKKTVQNVAITEMFHILGDLAFKRYVEAQHRVRDLHYFVYNEALENASY